MAILPLPASTVPFGSTGDGTPTTVFYSWLRALFDNLTALLALFPGGTSSAVWTAYTPVATAQTGTITTYTATGRFYQFGKLVFVEFEVHITNRGTGAGSLLVTIPVPANAAFNYALSGWEDDAPAGATAVVKSGGPAEARYASGGTLVVNSIDVTITGVYEAA